MTSTHLRLFVCSLFYLWYPTKVWADPCAAALGKVDPGGAAAVTANEEQAKQKVEEEYRHAKSQDGDAQWKARDMGKLADHGADHHQFETPFYAQGIAKAMAMGDVVTAGILGQCVARRSAQASADRDAARKNEAIGNHVTKEDQNGYNPQVIHVDKELAARMPTR